MLATLGLWAEAEARLGTVADGRRWLRRGKGCGGWVWASCSCGARGRYGDRRSQDASPGTAGLRTGPDDVAGRVDLASQGLDRFAMSCW